ncbi:MAG: hypothetical protein METHAR1v1_370010 [Methanothrix sp.]|nr:MAG: hypothetical protein METHAR1v1_370010 [Methanothrix sp.]
MTILQVSEPAAGIDGPDPGLFFLIFFVYFFCISSIFVYYRGSVSSDRIEGWRSISYGQMAGCGTEFNRCGPIIDIDDRLLPPTEP